MKELIHSNPELLITVVGIGGCGCNSIDTSKLTENDSLDDGLAYDDLVYDELAPNNGEEQSYTDIPAITRKLRADKLIGEKNA